MTQILRINKQKRIPDILRYGKILLSSAVVFYLFQKPLMYLFPILNKLNEFWSLVVWTLLIIYCTELVDIKIAGRDWF